MDNVHIKDAQSLINQVSNVNQIIENILRAKESITDISNEISNAWASNTIDKNSYLKKLNDNLTKMDTLISSMKSLSVHLQNYAYKQIKNYNG